MKMTTDSHNSNHFYVNVNFPKTVKGKNFPSKLIESLRDTDRIVHWLRWSLRKILKILASFWNYALTFNKNVLQDTNY